MVALPLPAVAPRLVPWKTTLDMAACVQAPVAPTRVILACPVPLATALITSSPRWRLMPKKASELMPLLLPRRVSVPPHMMFVWPLLRLLTFCRVSS